MASTARWSSPAAGATRPTRQQVKITLFSSCVRFPLIGSPRSKRWPLAAAIPPRRRHGAGGRSGDEGDADAGAWQDGYGVGYDADEGPSAGGGNGRSASLAALASNLGDITDTNALQTALAAAIGCEDFALAAAVRDRLRQVTDGNAAAGRIDWASTDMSEWLADRAQRLGFKFPTEIQRRAAPVLLAGADAVVASETGSGKTLSFLLPLLARLTYPPDIFLDQMKGPQALVVVPTLELGVQVALLAFRLLGGNISTGRPGDEANMFTYFGPKGIKVRGVLNKEEVVMAKSSLTYLSQVHLVVGTPAAVMEAFREPQPAQLLQHLKVLAVDEVDECFTSFPDDMQQLMAVAADKTGKGNSFGEKPQVVFVGATQRQDALRHAVSCGWLREPVSVQVGREGTIPTALSHRYIVVPPARRLAALARSLRADLTTADQDAAPARVMLFVNTPAEAAAVAEPLRTSLWSDHRMAVLVPPGTILGRDAASEEPPHAALTSPSSSSGSGAPRGVPGGTSSSRDGSTARFSSSSAGSGGSSAGGVGPAGRAGERAGGGGGKGGGAGEEALEDGASTDLLDEIFAYNPIRALHSFRDNKSSLLLATAAAARGLDLPAVSHVYSLGLPQDATQYLHRAGRAGRIGSTSGGVVTTLVGPDEVEALLDMGRQLGIQLVQEEEATGELLGVLPRLQAPSDGDGEEGEGEEEQAGRSEEEEATGRAASGRQDGTGQLGDVEKLRKGLEDLFNLM